MALAGAESAGALTETVDVAAVGLPFYSPRPVSEAPDGAKAFVERVHAADALILSSPLYHGSISGSFKNAIDWLQLLADRDPPYLTDKVVGLLAAAGGTQGLQAA